MNVSRVKRERTPKAAAARLAKLPGVFRSPAAVGTAAASLRRITDTLDTVDHAQRTFGAASAPKFLADLTKVEWALQIFSNESPLKDMEAAARMTMPAAAYWAASPGLKRGAAASALRCAGSQMLGAWSTYQRLGAWRPCRPTARSGHALRSSTAC